MIAVKGKIEKYYQKEKRKKKKAVIKWIFRK